ncbi:TrbI/VirB10 family protein [Vibrio sp. WXL103]|uniref:TrbI/VirB10 family protein n=1 Tax=unclassified Vibrio TaxID=2614977 RepID=UPI003EC6DA67
MSDETESQENEVNAGQKIKVYVFGGLVLVSLLFGVAALAERMQTKPTAQEPGTSTSAETQNQPTDVVATTFENVVVPREDAIDTFATPDKEPKGVNVESMVRQVIPSAMDNEVAAFESAEYKRAVLSARSSWNLTRPAVATAPAPEPPPQAVPATLTGQREDLLSTEEQRLMIAERMRQMQVLKQQIQSGDYSAFDPTQQSEQLQELQQSFSPPPTDIVGFTEENIYNASTEGLLKVPIGSIIPAVTMTMASSDNPGTFKALVSQDIFDVDQEYVLIPKGAEVIMRSVRIQGINEPINPRIGTTVPWIVLPNGNKIDLSKSSGLDRAGLSGLSDQVDRHLLEQFLGVAAYALVANSTSPYQGSSSDSDMTYSGEVAQGVRDQLAPVAQKYLSLTPTNTIRTGQSMNVIVENELYLKPWRHIYEDYL